MAISAMYLHLRIVDRGEPSLKVAALALRDGGALREGGDELRRSSFLGSCCDDICALCKK